MSTARLSKLHATGNDFLVHDGFTHPDSGSMAKPALLCDRHRGIGADGLMFLVPSEHGADCRMILWNADGAEAEMSGNGIRCLAWVAHRAGLGDGKRLVVDTAGGRREIDLELDERAEVVAATVDMGPATFDPSAIPLDAPSAFGLEATFHGITYEGDAAGMGNPHFVLFVDDPEAAHVATHGPKLEVDPRFPNRTNVEFIAISGTDEISMRVWERGVGETLSCGTGACAAAAVAHRRELVGERVRVRVPGGDLVVELGDTVRLGGSVRHVFDVDVDSDLIRNSVR
ncbi:MAG: diaminopimelate epimerase [Acidimicrobiia bacterium]